MKLLLDENLPKRLKENFSEHEIYTAADKGGLEFLTASY
jgi:predicted nuclease of predicted toxin-antitoxin system